ncbi:hypothetical protein TNCV_2101611 [Trichonephila clavipes]|nr:hypothetical protein TNCV_2101611 [Trichonephila clavipes]
MRARTYCAHPSIRDHWSQRCMSRRPDQVVRLKRGPQCLSPQESLALIYRPTAKVKIAIIVPCEKEDDEPDKGRGQAIARVWRAMVRVEETCTCSDFPLLTKLLDGASTTANQNV